MTKIDNIDAITKLIDVNLISKIEAFISINKRLSHDPDLNEIKIL